MTSKKCGLKTIAALISSAILLSIIGLFPLSSSAICCCRDGFDKSRYTLTGIMSEDVAIIAKSQKGRWCDDFGYSDIDRGAWCDEFVADCIENAGADSSIVGHGGGVHGTNNGSFEDVMRKKGAVEVSTPQVGDLIFFTKSHVEIVTKIENGVVYCAGGNNAAPGSKYKFPGCCAGERRASTIGTTKFYLRPKYENIIPPKPGTVLSVKTGSSTTKTVFSWDNMDGATEYDVKIWKGTLWDGDPYHVEWGASNPFSTILPSGTYHAYVDTRYGSEIAMSNVVEFIVTDGCELKGHI